MAVSKGGAGLKSGAALIRFLEFLCAALILGIFSYFLAYLTHHNQSIPTWMKAVEGISGAAVIYTAFAVLLVCFLGGITAFAIFGLLLDLLFCGAFVAIAVLTRAGAKTCTAARSPLSNNRLRDCRFQKAVFAVAIAGAVLFLLSAVMEILLNRHHKKEKRFGPGPSNDYTSGRGKKQPFWKRQRTSKTHDAELGAIGVGVPVAEEKHHHGKAIRPSHDSTVTGSTAAAPAVAYDDSNNKYQASTLPEGNFGPGYASEFPASNSHKVVHDRGPYAEVHHGGIPHVAQPSDLPTERYHSGR